MIDALKFCKTLFVDKIFGENCLIYENKLYGVHNEISIEIDCEIPFNCWVSFKLLSEILEKIKGKYVAVFENGTIIFTEIDTGIIYTIENVKPVTLTPALPNLDAFANYVQSDLEIFKTIAKEAERYLKTTGEDLFTDSLLIGQNFICATDKNIILMGIEPLLKDEFAINIKQVQHLNKFNRCSLIEYYTSETELVLIHENGLRVFLPIKRHEIVGNNLNRVYKVAMSRYSKNWVEIPDFKSIKINALLANKKLTYLKLTNEYLMLFGTPVVHVI